VGTGRFKATLEVKQRLGERFAFFVNLDWRGVDHPQWALREAQRLEEAVKLGARGVKIFKNLGVGVRTNDGELLKVDDPRLDPIMEKAGQLGAIVAVPVELLGSWLVPRSFDSLRWLVMPLGLIVVVGAVGSLPARLQSDFARLSWVPAPEGAPDSFASFGRARHR